MSAAISIENPTRGVLAYNASRVGMLQSCLSNLHSGLGTLPDLLQEMRDAQCWRVFKFPDSEVVRWNAPDFREFIRSPRPSGCQTPVHVLEQAIRGTPTWETYLDLTRGQPGRPVDADTPRNGSGQFAKSTENHNRYPITDMVNPDVIGTIQPAAPPPDPPRNRDYKREAPTGTSTSYNLRRLGNERPDLLDRVKAGELKPKTAMREAGLIRPEFSIPENDPQAAARRILSRYHGQPLLELIGVLANHCGGTFTEPEETP